MTTIELRTSIAADLDQMSVEMLESVSRYVSRLRSFVNTIYLGKKYKFPSEEVLAKLKMIADFVDVVDLRGQHH